MQSAASPVAARVAPRMPCAQIGDVADAVAGKINMPFPVKRKLVEDWENVSQK